MNRFRAISAAITSALLCAGAAAWIFQRSPAARPSAVSAEAPLPSPRAELGKAMAGWLLREGRRELRGRRFRAAAAIAEEAAFFAGDAGALALRAALEAESLALRAQWRMLSRDAAEAGDQAAGRRYQERLEEADGMEASEAADPR